MTRLRWWCVALVVWFFALYNVERACHSINLAGAVYVLAAAVGASLILVPALQRVALHWLLMLVLPLVVIVKVSLGQTLVAEGLLITVAEILALEMTVVLAHEVGRGIEAVRRVGTHVISDHLHNVARSFEGGQAAIYREIRRARHYGRPAAVLSIAASDESVNRALDRLVEAVRRETVKYHVTARVAQLLADEMNDCDIITRRNGHFVTLLPETEGQQAREVVRRLERTARERLGLELRIGMATFPEEEVTLEGLVERAEAAMRTGVDAQDETRQLVQSGRASRANVVASRGSDGEIPIIRMNEIEREHSTGSTKGVGNMRPPANGSGYSYATAENKCRNDLSPGR